MNTHRAWNRRAKIKIQTQKSTQKQHKTKKREWETEGSPWPGSPWTEQPGGPREGPGSPTEPLFVPHPNPHFLSALLSSLQATISLSPNPAHPEMSNIWCPPDTTGVWRKLSPGTDQFNAQTGSSAGSQQSPVLPTQQWARAGWLPSLDSGPTTQPSIRDATGFPRAREFLPCILKILCRSLFSCGQRPPTPECNPAGHSQSMLSSKSTDGHGAKLFKSQTCSMFYFSPALPRCQARVSS